MPPARKRPEPRELLPYLAGKLLRKKRRIHGDFGVPSRVVTNKDRREFMASMMETIPIEAHTPSIQGEKPKHRRMVLTDTGKWEHTIFRPFPRPWDRLPIREQERLYHYFTQAAKAYSREARDNDKHAPWIRALGNRMMLAKAHVDDVRAGLRVFRRHHGEPNPQIVREAKKYEEGWANLHSILKAIFERANREGGR